MASKSLLDKIEMVALSPSTSITEGLRMSVTLGGRAGSASLREWASRELHGYKDLSDLPEYRQIRAPILIDGVNGGTFGGHIVRGERISPSQLPDVVAAHISEELPLTHAIGELEELSRKREAIKFSLPDGADIVRLMNHEMEDDLKSVTNVYLSVAPSSLGSVVDRVRTTLVELIAEMRAGLAHEDGLPSSELADQAVRVAIHGDKNRVIVHSPSASQAESSISTSGFTRPSPLQLISGGLVGLATVAGAVFAGIQFFH